MTWTTLWTVASWRRCTQSWRPAPTSSLTRWCSGTQPSLTTSAPPTTLQLPHSWRVGHISTISIFWCINARKGLNISIYLHRYTSAWFNGNKWIFFWINITLWIIYYWTYLSFASRQLPPVIWEFCVITGLLLTAAPGQIIRTVHQVCKYYTLTHNSRLWIFFFLDTCLYLNESA